MRKVPTVAFLTQRTPTVPFSPLDGHLRMRPMLISRLGFRVTLDLHMGLIFLSRRMFYAFLLILDLHMRPVLRFVLRFRLTLDMHMDLAFRSRLSFRLHLDRVIYRSQISQRAVSIQTVMQFT